MHVKSVRVWYSDGTAQDMTPVNPHLGRPTPDPPIPQFKVGDLVRSDDPIVQGHVGVIRFLSAAGAGVEWAGFTAGHDLSPSAKTHFPRSGWSVFPSSLEYA